MPANVYECMLLLDSNKYNTDHASVINAIHALLEKHQMEVLASRHWDERRLAYPIDGHKKGTYYLLYLSGPGRRLAGLESDFRLAEYILRYLILKVHPKLVETLLAVARDENVLAVQAPGLAEETAVVGLRDGNGVPL